MFLDMEAAKTLGMSEDARKDIKEKVVMEAKDGGLMNLGGKEMDMRGGGFIPIGKKERADDVPARLSKNEFVMTAMLLEQQVVAVLMKVQRECMKQ